MDDEVVSNGNIRDSLDVACVVLSVDLASVEL